MSDVTKREGMSNSPSVLSAQNAGTPSPFPPPMGQLILLIEDDPFVGDVLERMLERLGKRVLRARNGTEGTQMFAMYEKDISLVMLDCFLPDMNGAALCRVFRQHSPRMPIILTSGFDNMDTKALLENGPTAFLAKPFYPRDVEQLVARMVAPAG
jgi:CheY-like chemotaxis protein